MSKTLTGRTNYRVHKRCFRPEVLVLRVEESWNQLMQISEIGSDGNFYSRFAHVPQLGWRDATVADLTELSRLEKQP